MNRKPKPKWIFNDGEMISLGFDTVEDAAEFIRSQSPNAPWRAQWTFRELEMNENKSTIAGERTHVFGAWAFGYGFVGGFLTLDKAKEGIATFRRREPSARLFEVHKCRVGWYERGFGTQVYTEGYGK